MSNKKSTRRKLLKQASLGAGLVASGTLPSAAAPAMAHTSTSKQLMSVDVLIVGGGPAGIGAALGAARTGANTLLIETHGFFGGVAAWSLGMPINQMRPERTPRSVVHELIIEKLVALGDQAIYIGQHQLYCNVDYLKVAVLDALDEVGCKYLVHLTAADAVMDGDRITGIIVSTKQGLAQINAKAVVDCTGDSDVAYFAGAETLFEREKPRMPNTLLFGVANVSPDQIRAVKMGEVAEKARRKYPLIPKGWTPRPVSNCHHYWINHTGTRDLGAFDMTDPVERSKAECASRRQVLQMVQAMREFGGEELKDIELVSTGDQTSVRETRRLKGEYILTEADAYSGRKFEDVIAWRSGYLDQMGLRPLTDMKIHDVPYRSILPVKVDGLLTGGRSISATHVAMAAGKSMGNCVATGHAAGLAAAMSAKKGIVPREINVAALQEALRKDEVNLDMGGHKQVDISGDRGV